MVVIEREGEDVDGLSDGRAWTQRAQLRADWESRELRAKMAAATWDKCGQLEVDMGQLKAMEGGCST